MYLSYFEIIVRFIITAGIVFFIGWNRQKKHKAAGITTHVILALSTCALAMFQLELTYESIELLKSNPHLIGSVTIENQRLIAQVLTGMGFIGAGAIFKSESHISGITTAATLWVSGVLGLIIGFGNYVIGGSLGIIVLIMINIFKSVLKRRNL